VSVVVDGGFGKRGRPSKEATETRRRELNARQRAYVVWMATPPAEREIRTQTELQEVLGVTQTTMWRWSKDPRVQEAIRFYTLQQAGTPERVRDILDMVYQVAMEKKDVKYAEIWMRASGVMSQFGRQTAADLLEQAADDLQEDIASLSLEELERVRELATQERAEAAAVEIATRNA
jgi:hypothetical protein